MPTPTTSVSPSISATDPRPSSIPSALAWMFALRISQRVPTIRVSYSTIRPRTNGVLANRQACGPLCRDSEDHTMWPSG